MATLPRPLMVGDRSPAQVTNARTREARVKNLLKALRGAPSRGRGGGFENTSTVAEEE